MPSLNWDCTNLQTDAQIQTVSNCCKMVNGTLNAGWCNGTNDDTEDGFMFNTCVNTEGQAGKRPINDQVCRGKFNAGATRGLPAVWGILACVVFVAGMVVA